MMLVTPPPPVELSFAAVLMPVDHADLKSIGVLPLLRTVAQSLVCPWPMYPEMSDAGRPVYRCYRRRCGDHTVDLETTDKEVWSRFIGETAIPAGLFTPRFRRAFLRRMVNLVVIDPTPDKAPAVRFLYRST